MDALTSAVTALTNAAPGVYYVLLHLFLNHHTHTHIADTHASLSLTHTHTHTHTLADTHATFATHYAHRPKHQVRKDQAKQKNHVLKYVHNIYNIGNPLRTQAKTTFPHPSAAAAAVEKK